MKLDIFDYETLEEAREKFEFKKSWEVFNGDRENLNIAYECVDRHNKEDPALRIKFADGRSEIYNFETMSKLTSQFAHLLKEMGINTGDTVALFVDPSLEFYLSFFGILKRGAVVVPCSPLFGPDAINYRIENSEARAVVVSQKSYQSINNKLVENIIVAENLLDSIQGKNDSWQTNTTADDLAIIQYSSGTTGTPKSVPIKHKSATVSAVNMKIRIGLNKNDNYFCPSSPAWGHGIFYGTIGPLIYGRAIGTYSGKFDVDKFLEALEEFEITNLSSTPTVFRFIAKEGKLENYNLRLRTMTFTGGYLDVGTINYFYEKLGVYPRTFYGATEVGAVLQEYPYKDHKIKPGSLGKPMLGMKVAVLDENDNPLPPGQTGRLAKSIKGQWVKMGDAGYEDEDGYFWYRGRVDDIIISAGYTVGPDEVENVLEKHPGVQRAAVIGSPDQDRGEIVKAIVVPALEADAKLKKDIQEFIKDRLSKHEYPREIAFVEELPQTPDGKIKRKELKKAEYEKYREKTSGE